MTEEDITANLGSLQEQLLQKQADQVGCGGCAARKPKIAGFTQNPDANGNFATSLGADAPDLSPWTLIGKSSDADKPWMSIAVSAIRGKTKNGTCHKVSGNCVQETSCSMHLEVDLSVVVYGTVNDFQPLWIRTPWGPTDGEVCIAKDRKQSFSNAATGAMTVTMDWSPQCGHSILAKIKASDFEVSLPTYTWADPNADISEPLTVQFTCGACGDG